MSTEYKTSFFSQKPVKLDMICNALSLITSADKNILNSGASFILVDDAHLKALLSLYVENKEILNSSACVLCCLMPKKIEFEEGYYLNKRNFLLRIFQRFFDFVLHVFKPMPKRIYSKLEESHYVELNLFQILGVVSERLKDLGLYHKIMLDIDRDRVAKVLGVSSDYRVHAIVGLGYAIEPDEPITHLKIHKNIFS